ncbi:DNA-processing protein DprA [Pseudoalteromonas sp. T1lg48]|uniref:DNA-processing protein DprA n=1 Tax=Pseudoalteromonas sp. T1lg48 TaxID=2077100 RepID=UPI000CF63A05|nr:DNA-processing protein DprA [Pseudoalteromonas sp. T1lg48]
MNNLDLPTLHALALQSQGLKAKEIKELLESIPYPRLSDIGGLKQYLVSCGMMNYFPNEKDWNAAVQIGEKSFSLGISCYSIVSNNYPKYLRAIDDAPNVLHLRGNTEALNKLPGVAVVGARAITSNGEIITRRISKYLADNDWIVVSGLALGVDAAAHEGALESGKPSCTIAVLAHGLDIAKPAKNAGLAQRILENGGLWVSEHPVGTPAHRNFFVPRNRIQLGLSVGSVIVEAEEKSGSITQARFCVKQRRPLYAVVPHHESNPLNLLCSGTKLLVEEMGAFPLKGKEDYSEMSDRFMRQKELMTSL